MFYIRLGLYTKSIRKARKQVKIIEGHGEKTLQDCKTDLVPDITEEQRKNLKKYLWFYKKTSQLVAPSVKIPFFSPTPFPTSFSNNLFRTKLSESPSL